MYERSAGTLVKAVNPLGHIQRLVWDGEKNVTDYFNELGFEGVHVVTDFPVTMSGSGRTFRAYIIRKNGVSGAAEASPAQGPAKPVEGAKERAPSSQADAKRRGGVKSERHKKKNATVLPFKKIKKYARSKHKVKISSTP